MSARCAKYLLCTAWRQPVFCMLRLRFENWKHIKKNNDSSTKK